MLIFSVGDKSAIKIFFYEKNKKIVVYYWAIKKVKSGGRK